ncbi:potassium channel family protein [Nocardioides aestuarii]|uniref:Potassium channel family protein n=1 Tax=Nocardioides aestuarii TaxID=252231 RepID=A0ABW4TGN1_9ACTN
MAGELGEERRERWEERTGPVLMLAALLFLVAFGWPIIEPDASTTVRTVCWALALASWVVFAADFVVRIVLSNNRVHFVTHSPLDVVLVLVPMLRPLSLLRVLSVIGILDRQAGRASRGRVALYVATSSALLITVCALFMLQAERGRPGSVIDSFDDALWWAATTVTTVGYGDTYPTTGTGRAVAAVLMFCGIALIGVVTATVAGWLISRVAEEEEAVDQVTQRDVEALTGEVRALRQELAEVRRRMDGDTPGA